MPWFTAEKTLTKDEILNLTERAAQQSLEKICPRPQKVLLLPPDITRAHSGAGWITEHLYNWFARHADVHLIPTLGQHLPHTPEQNRWMFGSVPQENIHAHDWRNGVKYLGEISADYVKDASGGRADWPIPVWLNTMLLEEKWDLIINIGHVVPHEVLGFANHNKNYFIGLGGKETICASHIMAACCGIENNLGQLVTPLRNCFNQAEIDLLSHLPDFYIQLVLAYDDQNQLIHTGYFVGDDLDTYITAAKASQKQNITIVDKPLTKVVATMQADEFHSTWVANKAIYRTRMAMADDGELLIIAPGLKRFGEQPEVDRLIRKYGYRPANVILDAYRHNPDLQDLAHGAAHLIHGASEGRFTITYAPGHLTPSDIESVGYQYADLDLALTLYPPDRMQNGWNTTPNGEEVFYISTPSTGLWSTYDKLYHR